MNAITLNCSHPLNSNLIQLNPVHNFKHHFLNKLKILISLLNLCIAVIYFPSDYVTIFTFVHLSSLRAFYMTTLLLILGIIILEILSIQHSLQSLSCSYLCFICPYH